MKLYKFALILVIIVSVSSLVGCGVAGSGKKPDESVTLTGQITAPAVKAPGILAASITDNASSTFAAIVASSTCKVNGQTVTMEISPNRDFEISNFTPASSYEVILKSKNLELSTFSPHTGRKITFPYGLSIKSTAENELRKMFAGKIGLKQNHLSGYSVKTQLIESLAKTLAGTLAAATATKDIYISSLNSSLQSISSANGTFDGMVKNGQSIKFSGKYSGNFFYYLFNSAGQKKLAVRATADLTLNSNGSSITGTVKIKPTGANPILPGADANEPSIISFAFSGSHNGTIATFDQKATAGPLSGKAISRWNLIPVSNGLACKVNNVDTAYKSGIETLLSSAILTPEDD